MKTSPEPEIIVLRKLLMGASPNSQRDFALVVGPIPSEGHLGHDTIPSRGRNEVVQLLPNEMGLYNSDQRARHCYAARVFP